MKQIDKLVQYLHEQQIHKHGLVVIPQRIYQKLHPTNIQLDRLNKQLKQHQITMTWAYGDNYTTFRKIKN